jgi:predicted nucleic acid-binding Zn ribbon protein
VVTCPACATENTAGAKFCTNCGAALPAAEPHTCVGCGAALPGGAKFCAACGRAVQPAAAASAPPEPPAG